MTPTIENALLIAGIGMVGIFIFMAVFYLLILALDRFLPFQEVKPIVEVSEESITDEEE
jgi:hypothetical protein